MVPELWFKEDKNRNQSTRAIAGWRRLLEVIPSMEVL
jgi:hypothetical protein